MSSLPTHVAIIMDGNSRWAKDKKIPKKEGHKAGVKAARSAIEFAVKNKINFLTLFAFSTENWGRSRTEVKALMELLVKAMQDETPQLIKNYVKVNLPRVTLYKPQNQKECDTVIELITKNKIK